MINLDGWVKLYRGITENWVWSDKPYSKGQAWLDLIILANHKDGKFPLGDEIVSVSRGCFITSELKLMDRWGWSKSKVRLFLNQLQNDSMIVKKTDRKKTTINIVNYGNYQECETTEEPKKDHQQTDDRPLKDTNKNVKNVKNNINNIPRECQRKYSDGSFEMKCVNYLLSSIRSDMPDAKLPCSNKDIDKWCDSIEKMVRLDKHSEDDIYKTLTFARTDAFWKVNIRSTSKFREKYETLYLQMKSKKTPQMPQPKQNSFRNAQERQYTSEDYAEIEKKLFNKGL